MSRLSVKLGSSLTRAEWTWVPTRRDWTWFGLRCQLWLGYRHSHSHLVNLVSQRFCRVGGAGCELTQTGYWAPTHAFSLFYQYEGRFQKLWDCAFGHNYTVTSCPIASGFPTYKISDIGVIDRLLCPVTIGLFGALCVGTKIGLLDFISSFRRILNNYITPHINF